MATFLRRYKSHIVDVAIALFRRTPEDWIMRNTRNIAVIYLKASANAAAGELAYRSLYPSRHRIESLQSALDTGRFGCDGIYHSIAQDSYSIVVPMIHIGLVIEGPGDADESLCFHDACMIEAPGDQRWRNLRTSWDALQAAVEEGKNGSNM